MFCCVVSQVPCSAGIDQHKSIPAWAIRTSVLLAYTPASFVVLSDNFALRSFISIEDDSAMKGNKTMEIRVKANPEAKTITIECVKDRVLSILSPIDTVHESFHAQHCTILTLLQSQIQLQRFIPPLPW